MIKNRLKKYILHNKLTSTKGETLAEVLVAVLIAGVGTLLLLSMLMSASKLVESGDAKVREVYNGGSAIEQSAADGSVVKTTGSAVSKDDTIVTITPSSGAGIGTSTVNVTVYKDATSGLALYEKAVNP